MRSSAVGALLVAVLAEGLFAGLPGVRRAPSPRCRTQPPLRAVTESLPDAPADVAAPKKRERLNVR